MVIPASTAHTSSIQIAARCESRIAENQLAYSYGFSPTSADEDAGRCFRHGLIEDPVVVSPRRRGDRLGDIVLAAQDNALGASLTGILTGCRLHGSRCGIGYNPACGDRMP